MAGSRALAPLRRILVVMSKHSQHTVGHWIR
jgi:hypothetical protein